MGYKSHDLGALVRVDPQAAAAKIVAAYTSASCSQRDAATLLGVEERSLIRWTKKLDEALAAMRKVSLSVRLAAVKARAIKEGWHHDRNRQGGRPKGSRTSKASKVRRKAA